MNTSIRRTLYSIVVLVGLNPALVAAQGAAAEQLVIRGGWLFDGISDTRRRNTGIVIQQDKIVGVDGDNEQQVLATTELTAVQGKVKAGSNGDVLTGLEQIGRTLQEIENILANFKLPTP